MPPNPDSSGGYYGQMPPDFGDYYSQMPPFCFSVFMSEKPPQESHVRFDDGSYSDLPVSVLHYPPVDSYIQDAGMFFDMLRMEITHPDPCNRYWFREPFEILLQTNSEERIPTNIIETTVPSAHGNFRVFADESNAPQLREINTNFCGGAPSVTSFVFTSRRLLRRSFSDKTDPWRQK